MKIKLLTWVLVSFLWSCASEIERSAYDLLTDYEGEFEYTNPNKIVISASPLDTALFAILDEAKYPLKRIAADTFMDASKTKVIFKRDKEGKVDGYMIEGRVFKLLNKVQSKQEWYPRRELYGQEDNYQYQVPKEMGDGLKTGDIATSFNNSAQLISMVKQTIKGEYPDVHSILIWKDGKLVLEEYFYEYTVDKPHQLRSASKSFISALVGIAIDQNKIKDENQLLLPFFDKEYSSIENRDSRKDKITIKDFLTYRHGMDCNDEDPNTAGYETKMYETNDWIKFTLDLPMIQEPGEKSSYCSACAQTLARLVEITAQTPVVEFADKNLFGPMGITNYKWRYKPDTTSAATFNQMYIRPRDMLKLALMYKDAGRWNGKQIISEDWVRKTFAKEDVEFGYLGRHKSFDVNNKHYESYLATGNGGQKINIWPELNMITVFTGGNYNSYLYGRTTPPNEMIPKYILNGL